MEEDKKDLPSDHSKKGFSVQQSPSSSSSSELLVPHTTSELQHMAPIIIRGVRDPYETEPKMYKRPYYPDY
jgi:hypothetical protein